MATVDIRGQVVVFDDSDRPLFDAHKWWVTDRGYVLTKIRGEDGKGGQSGCTGCCLATPKRILTTLTGIRETTLAEICERAEGQQTTRTSQREITKRLAIAGFQSAATGGRW